jgi:hypothetical protein
MPLHASAQQLVGTRCDAHVHQLISSRRRRRHETTASRCRHGMMLGHLSKDPSGTVTGLDISCVRQLLDTGHQLNIA